MVARQGSTAGYVAVSPAVLPSFLILPRQICALPKHQGLIIICTFIWWELFARTECRLLRILVCSLGCITVFAMVRIYYFQLHVH